MTKRPDAPGLTRAQIDELEAELRAELARIERTARADAADGGLPMTQPSATTLPSTLASPRCRLRAPPRGRPR